MAVGDGARWGKESLFKINSPTWGDLIINDRSSVNRHHIDTIDGLFSDPDIREQREANPNEHGELRIGNEGLLGGKTIVIRGRTIAQDMLALRMMQRQMRRVTNELLGVEKPLYIYSDTRFVEQNFILNPSSEVDVSNWYGGNAGTLSRSTAQAWTGTASTLWSLAAGSRPDPNQNTVSARADSLVVGQKYVASIYVRTRLALTVGVSTTTGNGGSIASTAVTALANQWQRVTIKFTATATTHYLYATPGAINDASTFDLYLDGAMIHPGETVLAYFDGESSGYSWDGARYGSKSTSMRSVFLNVAKSQPLVMDERQESFKLEREFMLTLRATNPRILGQYLETATISLNGSSTGNVTARNEGDYPAQLSARFTGPMTTSPKLENLSANKTLQTYQAALQVGQYTDFAWDGVSKRITDQTGAARPSRFDPVLASWLEVIPGDNTMRATLGSPGSAGTAVSMSWRDSWM